MALLTISSGSFSEHYSGGLTLAEGQVPTKPLYHSPSSAGQGEKSTTKGPWVEIRTGKDCSPINIMGKTDSIWEN